MIDLKSVLGKAALVVIDVQKGIVALDRKLEPNSPAEVVANVSKLVGKFREVGSLVFLVHVAFVDGKDMLHQYWISRHSGVLALDPQLDGFRG